MQMGGRNLIPPREWLFADGSNKSVGMFEPDWDPLSESGAHMNKASVSSCGNWGLDWLLAEQQAGPTGKYGGASEPN